MIKSGKLIVVVCLASTTMLSACSSGVTPTPTPTGTPTATVTPVPTFTSTLLSTATFTPTSAPTSPPASTSTPTRALTPTSTPLAVKPTSLPTIDPIANRQTFSSANVGFSIAYPGGWQPGEKDTSATIGNQELKDSNRAKGAELIVVVSPQADPDLSLQAKWDTVPAGFPAVRFGQPVAITIGGEKALRAVFSDPRDNSHGWFILVKHNGYFYIIIAQAIPDDNWVSYENTFRAMLSAFRFLK